MFMQFFDDLIRLPGRAREALDGINAIRKELTKMSDALARIKAAVVNLTTVDQSAIATMQQLAAEIRAKADDSDALNELADSIDADAQGLSDAITANTQAAPAPISNGTDANAVSNGTRSNATGETVTSVANPTDAAGTSMFNADGTANADFVMPTDADGTAQFNADGSNNEAYVAA